MIALGASTIGVAACAPKIIGATYPAANNPSKNAAVDAFASPPIAALVSPLMPKFVPVFNFFAIVIDPRINPPARALSGVNMSAVIGPWCAVTRAGARRCAVRARELAAMDGLDCIERRDVSARADDARDANDACDAMACMVRCVCAREVRCRSAEDDPRAWECGIDSIAMLKGDNTKGARADEDCFGFDWFLMYTWLICDCMAMMKSNSTKARERELRGSGANEEDVAKGAKGG